MGRSRSDIPVATVTRLALYLRELQQLQRSGASNVQSSSLASRLGFNDSQVRRDISCLGQIGQRGVGYNVAQLILAMQEVLGTDRSWNVILVGFGNLGRALSGYRGFDQQGFRLIGIFDDDVSKIGTKVHQLTVMDLQKLESFVESNEVDLAILAVPASAAPGVAEKLASVGISGILNFAPVTVRRSKNLTVVDVDLAIELQRLAFAVVNREDSDE